MSEEYLRFVCDQLSDGAEVAARRMFGGAGLYCEGVMFGLVADDTAYLKVDDSNRPVFEAVGSTPFKPYKDKPMTMSYYEVPPEVLEDGDAFRAWAQDALEVARRARKK